MAGTRAGFLPARVVHLHLTRRCNLTCSHCYSASSPAERDILPASSFLRALEALRREGYDTLSLSGGEPLLYRQLDELLTGAVDLGFKINLITNGTVLTPSRLEMIAGRVSLAAVSFDGPPEVHNRMRGRADAYDCAVAALDRLASAGVCSGIAYCVGRNSLPGVADVYDLAVEKRIRSLHLHPLVAIGRAESECPEQALDELDQARLYMAAGLFDANEEGPRVHCDLLPVAALHQARRQFRLLQEDSSAASLAELVNPLILTETGSAIPFAYGLDKSYELPNAGRDWSASLLQFKQSELSRLGELVSETFDAIAASGAAFVEWYGWLVRTSSQVALPAQILGR